MGSIRWSEAMSVGVARLDRDHQILVGLINRIDEAGEDESTRNRVLPEVLAILIAYTVFHFEREEKVMRRLFEWNPLPPAQHEQASRIILPEGAGAGVHAGSSGILLPDGSVYKGQDTEGTESAENEDEVVAGNP